MSWSTPGAHEGVRDIDGGNRGRSSLFVMLTGRCNMSCSYCYQTRSGARSMSPEILRQALDFGLRRGASSAEFNFTGGEALLEWERLQWAVRYCREARRPEQALLFGLLTNGLRMTPEVCAYLAEQEFSVQLSCDGIDAAQERRGRGSLDTVLGVLGHLRQEHPTLFLHDLVIAMTVPRESIPHMAESIELLLDQGVRHIAIAPGLTRSNEWTPGDEDELRRQLQDVAEISLRQLRERHEIPVLMLREPPPDPSAGRHQTRSRSLLCAAVHRPTLAVDTDGSLLGCLLFSRTVQDFGEGALSEVLDRISLGQVGDADGRGREAAYLERIQEEPLFMHMEEWRSSDRRCADCAMSDRCAVCPIDHARDDELFRQKRVLDYQCAFNRIALETQARFWRDAPGLSPGENDLLLRDRLRELERTANSLRFGEALEVPETTDSREAILGDIRKSLEKLLRRSEAVAQERRGSDPLRDAPPARAGTRPHR